VIHATAIVDPGAELGPDVQVGPYAIIGPDVVIGEGTSVGPHAVIRGATTIGADNRIFQFASIGDEPQDKKYAGEPTRLEIGDRNTIRECCTINRGTAQDAGVTRIGNDNWIMAYVHVAHDCQVGNEVVLANNSTLAGHVKVGDFVIMGGFSGAHQFCQIGAYAFLGMYSGVTRDVPAYCMVAGRPAVPKGVNTEGLKRRGFSSEQVRNIRRAYRLLYRSGMKLEEALASIEADMAEQPELREFAASIRAATRSIVR
jgi:UDP-N-acetylglucosamine acyltransferase